MRNEKSGKRKGRFVFNFRQKRIRASRGGGCVNNVTVINVNHRVEELFLEHMNFQITETELQK